MRRGPLVFQGDKGEMLPAATARVKPGAAILDYFDEHYAKA
jgi:hypothetical protein